MTTRHGDRRVSRTRRVLHEALRSLILEKGDDRVTVQDVIDRADVGRATFYAHFRDKDDLLMSGFEEMRLSLRQQLAAPPRTEDTRAHDGLGFTRALFEHAAGHRREYRAQVGSRSGGAILEAVHKELTSHVRAKLDQAIARGTAYAPYADLVWCETASPDLHEAKQFAEGIHRRYPGKPLAYNCSPSFNWKMKLDDATIARFQRELGAMGYRFQFITLAGFHAINFSMYELARGYRDSEMSAYVSLQQAEFAAEAQGYTATRHQREVGAGYFDDVTQTVTAGTSSITAMKGSTEEAQFEI